MIANNLYTVEQVKAAISELQNLIVSEALECQRRGWWFYITDHAPETWDELSAFKQGKLIPVASYGSEKTIYDSPMFNYLFRFWHDVLHLETGYDLSYEGEMAVAQMHVNCAINAGLSQLAVDIMAIDTKGQVEYYRRRHAFVDDQEAFMYSALRVGYKTACAIKH